MLRPKQQVYPNGIEKKSLEHEKSQNISFVPHQSSKYPFESTFAPRISPHEDIDFIFDSDVY